MRADAASAHFNWGSRSVETPFPVGLDERNWKGPVFIANREDRAILANGRNFDAVLGARKTRELVLFGAILRGFAGSENGFRLWAENGGEPGGVVMIRGIDHGLGSGLGRIEALLRDGRRGRGERHHRENSTESDSHCFTASPRRRHVPRRRIPRPRRMSGRRPCWKSRGRFAYVSPHRRDNHRKHYDFP